MCVVAKGSDRRVQPTQAAQDAAADMVVKHDVDRLQIDGGECFGAQSHSSLSTTARSHILSDTQYICLSNNTAGL